MPAPGLLLAALVAQTPASTPRLAAEFQPLAFLVGSCWRTTLPGTQVTDTHCFTAMFGGRFVRDRHRLNGADYAGESIYRWDGTARQIRFDYYQSQGLVIRGTAAPAPRGLTFDLSVPSASGPPLELRASWTRDGEDAYVVTQEMRDGDAWRPLRQRPRFERVSPAPAD